MTSLRFRHVSKTFPTSNYAAVNDCTLDIESSGFVVLLGPSGCGKTTLLKMVNRLIEPTAGEILMDDKNIRDMDVTTLRRHIGYVIQQVGLFPHLTVAQNIAVVPELLGWAQDKINTRIDELLQLVQLKPDYYRNRYPAQLSGGQQQRIGLARALAADPQLLLMDEPFGAIDAITRTSLQDEMLRLKNTIRKTILFVTHDVEEALRLADKIVIMQSGKIVQYDTPFNILTRPANDFVHKLVGSDDMVRQLSLIPVSTIMTPISTNSAPNNAPTIAPTDDLRTALSKLLQSGASSLTVVQNDQPIGTLSLDQIRTSARQHS